MCQLYIFLTWKNTNCPRSGKFHFVIKMWESDQNIAMGYLIHTIVNLMKEQQTFAWSNMASEHQKTSHLIKRSGDRLMLIMGISILIRRYLLNEWRPTMIREKIDVQWIPRTVHSVLLGFVVFATGAFYCQVMKPDYCQIANIKRTKSQNLNVFRCVFVQSIEAMC